MVRENTPTQMEQDIRASLCKARRKDKALTTESMAQATKVAGRTVSSMEEASTPMLMVQVNLENGKKVRESACLMIEISNFLNLFNFI